MNLLWAKICIPVVLAAFTTVAAEDRVTYRPVGASRPITVIGDIIDYTGRDLTMRTQSGIPQLIPAEDVIAVKTHYDSVHREGIEAYNSGRIEQAYSKFVTAYDREPREWVDREIAAWIVRCSLSQGDSISALQYFRTLVKSDPYTRHWGVAPLVWLPVSTSETLRKTARPMLVSSYSGERLLGASLLLFDGTSGTIAKRELGNLASDPNPRISRLARAQLWRLAIAENKVTKNILHGWRDQIDRMPDALRPGPQYMLGRGYAHLGEQRLAAAEFLKLTILHTSNDALTARATLEAAEAIERTGLTQEADLLYRELLVRFPTSRESKIARKKLAENTKGS